MSAVQDELAELLTEAIKKNDVAAAQEVFEKGFDIDQGAAKRFFFLHAVAQDSPAILRLLLKRVKDPENLSANGQTALHWAASGGRVECLRVCLEFGLNINAATVHTGLTPLHQAIKNGHAAAVSLLLESGADARIKTRDDDTVFHMAAANSGAEIIRMLAATNAADMVSASDSSGLSPLHIAAAFFNVHAIHALAGAGAEVNKVGHGGYTPLHHVLRVIPPQGDERLKTVKALIEVGADVLKANDSGFGNTPLHLAARCGGDGGRLVECLLKHSFNGTAAKNSRDETPLHWAVGAGPDATVELLIKAGADVNAQSKFGVTPLHFAVSRRAFNAAEILLAHGADPNIRAYNDDLPEDAAPHHDVGQLIRAARLKNTPPS